MKQFILFILVLLPVCAFAQFTETFDGPILNVGWIGGRDSFLIEGGQLKLNAPGGKSGIASLKHIIPYASNMQWEFEAQINTNPSDNNNVRIALYDEGGIYYYVQIGFAGKNKIGFRRSKQKDMFERQENNLGNKTHLAIKVTLEDNKYWTMYSRQINETYYKLEGSCTYPIIAAKDSGYFLINIIYTGGRNKHFLLDNIYVSDKITPTVTEPSEDPEEPDDPSEPDITLPKLLSIEPLTLSDLQFVFDLPVKTEQATFSVSNIGNADRIAYADESRKIVNTHYPEEMKTGEVYTISYSGVMDEKGSTLDGYSEKVTVEEEGEGDEEPSDSKAIVINEIMAKPGDGSFFEYVELYNPTDRIFSLNELELWNGNKRKVLPDVVLPPHEYALLYNSNIDYSGDGVVIPIEKFYALNDAGQHLALKTPSGVIIDEVTYEKATPAKSWERSSSGWYLSSDPRGGTPGSANSSGEGEEKPNEPVTPDEPDEPDTPDEPSLPDITVEPGEFVINELLPNPFIGGSEYIELYNRSGHALPVSGLSIAVRKADGTLNTRYPLSSVTSVIESDGYVLLTKNLSGVTDFYTILSPSSLFEVPKLPILANTSSTLVLFRTKDEVVIDEVSYSSKWHASSVKDQKGVALERIDPEAETQSAANWTSASATAGYGTPGYQNSQSGISSPDDPDSPDEPTGIEVPQWDESSGHYTISYYLDQPGYSCRVFIFNLAGIRVAEIANHELLGMKGQLTWDGYALSGKQLQTGIYIFYAELYHITGTVKRYKHIFPTR
ncbi:lamin tail domain-containing protein [Parabacteroides faecis]|uniref:lamin tail domain-containing protein n=1 Tax=Parabacteroides TaxID=375288 RepID=UPI000F00DD7F|nr:MULTISPECIES: lamin tail domain-containing protein [Parabacteroides]MBC8619803.1 lamin tail domain-containing protein [Parabacteroides faecis]RHS00611.1 lamin tail domain-containing protein [Parabacteroides sp. AF14-59]